MSTKQDLDNYLERITAIQKAIITDAQAAKYPLPSSPVPYWLNVFLPSRIRPNTDNQSSMITFVLRMILVRTSKENMFQPEWEVQIGADMTEVVWNFMTNNDYRRLIVGAYPEIQPGFLPGSAKVVSPARVEFITNVGEVLGSSYILEWQHRMTRDIGT